MSGPASDKFRAEWTKRHGDLPNSAEVRVVNATTGGEKGSKAERWDLLPMDQLAKVARLYGFGATKYADHNWRKGFDWNLSIGALYRHMGAFVHGEDFDAESECEHLTSVAFHALALLYFMDAHRDLDDRFVPPTTVHEPTPGVKWNPMRDRYEPAK